MTRKKEKYADRYVHAVIAPLVKTMCDIHVPNLSHTYIMYGVDEGEGCVFRRAGRFSLVVYFLCAVSKVLRGPDHSSRMELSTTEYFHFF